jgi:flavorubredoxin
VTKGVKCLRGVCNERLKLEVEYSLKKGTSENSYLLSVSHTTAAAVVAAAAAAAAASDHP